MAELRALVLDDDEMMRTLYKHILEERQVRVVDYANPAEFMNEHRSDRCSKNGPCFDVILTDNQMPFMTGLAFLKELEGMECLVPKGQTAIISGTWSPKDLKSAQGLGCRIFEKPCPVEKILEWVDGISTEE